jgi:hypothetical protein
MSREYNSWDTLFVTSETAVKTHIWIAVSLMC